MKFNINDLIIYGTMGVCEIVEIEKEIGRNPREYYVLSPVYSKNMVVKIPVDNDKVVMRRIHTKDEVDSLISDMNSDMPIWVEDEKARVQQFKAMIKSAKCEDLITVIRSINGDKKKRKLQGKKLYKGDEEMMQTAQKMLNEEFATILDISPEQVKTYIKNHAAHK